MFFVLKHEHARKIPSRLVLNRWRKDTKSLENYGEGRADECSERGFLLRQGALHYASQWFSFVAACSPGLFKTAMSGIRVLCKQIEAACDQKGPSAKGRDTPSVKDPVVVKTKVAPRVKKMSGRKRRCSMCWKAGHTKRHYTKKRGVNMQADPQEDGNAVDLGSEGSSPTENAKVDVTRRKCFHLKWEKPLLSRTWKNPGSGQMRGLMHDIIRVTERLASYPRQV
ncbi:uncharacterized protein DS421_7g200520 [Arachis hypogaea]|nr:uncharacterized protein DS421_7g200520 [Arachis hypogaea]